MNRCTQLDDLELMITSQLFQLYSFCLSNAAILIGRITGLIRPSVP